jgi:hypothetical protein
MYIPKTYKMFYDKQIFKLPFIDSKFLVNVRIKRMYNNIFLLWKMYKFKKYVDYLEINLYSNPQLPYMKHYIENELFEEDKKEFKVGYINDSNKLIWYKLSR